MRSRVSHSGEPAADIEFCLVFPGEAVSVPVMRRVLGDTLTRLGIHESCVTDMLLAVTEACSNAVRHAGPGRRYEVLAHVSSTRCVLEVVDGGRWPDTQPAHAPALRRLRGHSVARFRRPPVSRTVGPSPVAALRGRIVRPGRLHRPISKRAVASLPESGRGLAIMQACVDDVSMRSRPGQGTVVSLRKQIEWRSDAPLPMLAGGQLRDAG
jgi:serine/threonine-protein kinase RsbW